MVRVVRWLLRKTAKLPRRRSANSRCRGGEKGKGRLPTYTNKVGSEGLGGGQSREQRLCMWQHGLLKRIFRQLKVDPPPPPTPPDKHNTNPTHPPPPHHPHPHRHNTKTTPHPPSPPPPPQRPLHLSQGGASSVKTPAHRKESGTFPSPLEDVNYERKNFIKEKNEQRKAEQQQRLVIEVHHNKATQRNSVSGEIRNKIWTA